MNAILRSYFNQIDAVIADLGETLSDQAIKMQNQQKARETLQAENWSQSRQIATLQEDRGQFERLQAENERLRGREDALRERLKSVLKHTKALAEGMRP